MRYTSRLHESSVLKEIWKKLNKKASRYLTESGYITTKIENIVRPVVLSGLIVDQRVSAGQPECCSRETYVELRTNEVKFR